jgi:hypothetical protein
LKTRKDSDSQPPLSPAGAYRFAPDPVQKSESESRKREEKRGKDRSRMLSFTRDEIGTAKLFINSKFCMILVALIPVMNYNA